MDQNNVKTTKQLTASKLSDMAAHEIVAYILQRGIKPGETIPSEKQFSEYFGIGRTSVREGISRLMSAGLLHSIQGYGIVLNEITIESYFKTMESSILKDFIEMDDRNISELIDTRIMIESLACQIYIQEGKKEDLLPLKEILYTLNDSLTDLQLFMKNDIRFHQYLVSLSKNRIISLLYTLIRELVAIEIGALLPLKGMPPVQEEHVAIYYAMENKDPRAPELLRAHLERIKTIQLERDR
jgi:GntR family transcriptional repressor for pyruvate dehydrogenase complex